MALKSSKSEIKRIEFNIFFRFRSFLSKSLPMFNHFVARSAPSPTESNVGQYQDNHQGHVLLQCG